MRQMRKYRFKLIIGSMVVDTEMTAKDISHLWHIIDYTFYDELKRSAVMSLEVEEVVND